MKNLELLGMQKMHPTEMKNYNGGVAVSAIVVIAPLFGVATLDGFFLISKKKNDSKTTS